MASLNPAVSPASTSSRGFTLTEMAVVLVIVALLVGGMLIPMSAQQDVRYMSDTQTTLKNIHEALLGFAVANGRLPCPATIASDGAEKFVDPDSNVGKATGECEVHFDGYVPAVTLGIQPTDSSGFAIDAWGNRIRYAVTDKTVGTTARALTRTDGMRAATMSGIAGAVPLLSVCVSATGVTGTSCGTAVKMTDAAPVLIFSTGKNGPNADADEQANLTTVDAVFVGKDAAGKFDDQLIWMSSSILFNRMIAAGRLP